MLNCGNQIVKGCQEKTIIDYVKFSFGTNQMKVDSKTST